MEIFIISLVILIFSVIIHELAHGYMAEALGDPTARLEGRLTINPLAHLDPIGSIVVPIITSMAGFTFGWAKPVPYNPYNLKNPRRDELLVALAGPFSNLLIAFIFGIIIRFFATEMTPFFSVLMYVVLTNIVLAIFNLIPLPPLDGSKVLFSIWPARWGNIRYTLETYAPIWILLVVFFLWQFIAPIVPFLFSLITGISM